MASYNVANGAEFSAALANTDETLEVVLTDNCTIASAAMSDATRYLSIVGAGKTLTITGNVAIGLSLADLYSCDIGNLTIVGNDNIHCLFHALMTNNHPGRVYIDQLPGNAGPRQQGGRRPENRLCHITAECRTGMIRITTRPGNRE